MEQQTNFRHLVRGKLKERFRVMLMVSLQEIQVETLSNVNA